MVVRKKRFRYKLNAIKIAKENNLTLNPDNWEEVWNILDKFDEPIYLYAIVDNINSLVKFGKSKHPQSRLKQIKTGNACNIKLWAFCLHISPFTEKEIHKLLSNNKVYGEWFKFNNESQIIINKMREFAGI